MSPITQFVLDEYRKQGWSKVGLAKRAGHGESILYDWEWNRSRPTLYAIERMLKALGYKLVIVPTVEKK